MFGYYLELARRSVWRSGALTVLIIAAIGVGVGASVTLFSTLQAMSTDPIPARSRQLFNVQVDNWGKQQTNDDISLGQMAYPDAVALLHAKPELHQSPMYAVTFNVQPLSGDMKQFVAPARAVTADFFAMFMAPFVSGAPWLRADDRRHANLVVLGASLAAGLYPQGPAYRSASVPPSLATRGL